MTARQVVSIAALGFQASWSAPEDTDGPKAFVVEPYLWESGGTDCIAPRYIALYVSDGLRINVEDTAIAEKLVEVLTEAIAEKRRLDEADAADAAAAARATA